MHGLFVCACLLEVVVKCTRCKVTEVGENGIIAFGTVLSLVILPTGQVWCETCVKVARDEDEARRLELVSNEARPK